MGRQHSNLRPPPLNAEFLEGSRIVLVFRKRGRVAFGIPDGTGCAGRPVPFANRYAACEIAGATTNLSELKPWC